MCKQQLDTGLTWRMQFLAVPDQVVEPWALPVWLPWQMGVVHPGMSHRSSRTVRSAWHVQKMMEGAPSAQLCVGQGNAQSSRASFSGWTAQCLLLLVSACLFAN